MNYKHIDLQHLMELSGNDMDFVTDILGDALVIIPESLLAMNNAVDSDNRTDIIFHAHKIKGTFRFIGCHATAAIAEQIENDKELPIENVRLLIGEIGENWLQIADECRNFIAKK